MLVLLFFLVVLTSQSCSYNVSTNQAPNKNLEPNTMDPSELQTLYTIMETLSSDQKWRLSYPNPCKTSSSWVGIECKPGITDTHLHVTRLDFGTPPNPSCKKSAIFPSQIFQLPYLQSIFFFQCFKITKTTLSLSPNYKSPSSLQQLSLRSNPSLVGPIPSHLFSHLTSLQILTLSQNRISGEIPPEISGLTSIIHLDLSYNQLSGPIPFQVCRLKNLVGLDLSYNSFTGQIPNTIGQLGMLQKLDLSSNLLTGAIPRSIEKLCFLVFMALSNNGFRGKFPIGFSNLKTLEYLIIENNPMFINLPLEFGQLPKLQELRLANSGYSGEIPTGFSQLTNLTTLSLQNNRLTGNIPVGFGNLSHIYHLNLSRNLLSGIVPFNSSFLMRLGKNLDLSGNGQLCLNSSEEYVAVKLGVDVCRGRNNSSSKIQPLKTSQACVVVINSTLFFLFIGLEMLVFHHIFLFV